jgi:hypothetical protein
MRFTQAVGLGIVLTILIALAIGVFIPYQCAWVLYYPGLPILILLLVIVASVIYTYLKLGSGPPPLHCKFCHESLFGGETFCPHCGKAQD